MDLLIIVNISLDIFYHQINDYFQGYEFICTSIEELLIFTKIYLKHHIQVLEFILLIQEAVNSLSERFRIVILAYATAS